MFNWICPECGRDVSPSETECRFCAERKKAAGVPLAEAPAAPGPPHAQAPPPPRPQPQYQAPPQPQYQPPQPQYQAPPQPSYYPPPPTRAGLPTWALAVLFSLAFIGLGAAVYFGYQYFGKGPRAERAGVTEPAAAARTKPTNVLQKYIEVVGIRLVQDPKKKPIAKFVVVNHSNAELTDLTANVTIWASTSRSEEDSVGTFSFKLPSIAANESKDMTAAFTTKLKMYEMPDWQNATAEVQISQP
jgi:hypothetical protein